MKKVTKRLLIVIPAVLAMGISTAHAEWDEDKGCLSCHEGIEQFSEIEEMADLTCVDCHNGKIGRAHV